MNQDGVKARSYGILSAKALLVSTALLTYQHGDLSLRAKLLKQSVLRLCFSILPQADEELYG